MPVDRGTGMFYDLQSSLESEENFIEDDESLDKHADLRSYVQKGFYPKLVQLYWSIVSHLGDT
jgi:hypothetical protein